MRLIYCYIERFRNIQNQGVLFSNDFRCQYKNTKLLIEKADANLTADYVYGNEFMRNIRLLVGKTGSGKTNLLQMIGMDEWQRMDSAKIDSYFMLYKMDAQNEFFIEVVGNVLLEFAEKQNKERGHKNNIASYKITYDFEHNRIVNVIPAISKDTENTVVVNAFDRNAFACCPYDDERQGGFGNHDGFIGRMITQFGNSSVSMECNYLKHYLEMMPKDSIKRKTSLVIRWDNWQYKHRFDLDERLIEQDYWTYKDKAERQRLQNAKKGKHSVSIKYGKGSTPKRRFLHDLMTDFAIYLRKWAECLDEDFPEDTLSCSREIYDLGIEDPTVLPDGKKISILKRIDWLCQYIDYHTDEMFGNRGLIWQIGDNIKDIFNLLNKMDDKYFTEEEFSIPVMDIDLSEKSAMHELFERMEQYRPDQVGVFTNCLLPYKWTHISSGEYQYAKVWGILEEYGVKIKILKQSEKFSEARQPNMILLLDEPENYMHPEMCRTFIHNMNELLHQRNPQSELQVILSTHSPFMLSDVLSNQIIKMDYDEMGLCVISNAEKPSFAANIHSIMADSFFLKYTIGEQARLFLSEKFDLFRSMLRRRDDLSEKDRIEIKKMSELLPNIGDELIRHSFASIIENLQ